VMFANPYSKFIPPVSQLGKYLKMGLDHYAMLKNEGTEAGPDLIAAFLMMKMADWDPKLNNQSLLDDKTRAAAARFLAGVAVNFAGGE
jgi:hypothetical protein